VEWTRKTNLFESKVSLALKLNKKCNLNDYHQLFPGLLIQLLENIFSSPEYFLAIIISILASNQIIYNGS